MNDLILDELQILLNQEKDLIKKLENKQVNIYSDGNGFAKYFNLLMNHLTSKGSLKHVDYADFEHGLQIKSHLKADIIYFIINCRDDKYTDWNKCESAIETWKQCMMMGQKQGAKLVLIPIIQNPIIKLDGVTAFAEREYTSYLGFKDQTCSEKFYLHLENTTKKQVELSNVDVTLLRLDNILGPSVDMIENFSVKDFLEHSDTEGVIRISKWDAENYISLIYTRDAVRAIIFATLYGKNGHIYNVTGDKVNYFELKQKIRHALVKKPNLLVEIVNEGQEIYHCLDALKLTKQGWNPKVDLEEAVYRTTIYYHNDEYNISRQMSIYSGRLDRIKQIELNILKTVDSICKENDIQYFLGGGSLLGAIRHQDIIPWDDDVDIVMLRADFEKFRKICKDNLPEYLTYESASYDKDNHYYFDKIRVKSTYLSTEFSKDHQIPNGIFLDIVVYDQTSNNKFLSRMHVALIFMWARLINLKWYNKPKDGKDKLVSKLVLPLVRIIPFSVVHKTFERLLRLYENKSNAKYLVDGVGQNLRRGPFKKEWFEKTEYVDFRDMKAPVPADYNSYLRHFYGDRYMELLPISSRVSGHQIVRIDLGEFLFGDRHVNDVDFRGELYEKEQQ